MNTGASETPKAKPEGSRWSVLGRTGAGHIGVGTHGEHVTDGVLFVNGLHEDALQNAALAASAPTMQAAIEKALGDLENMTTDAFSKGADTPLREALQVALDESRKLPVLEKRERKRRARK